MQEFVHTAKVLTIFVIVVSDDPTTSINMVFLWKDIFVCFQLIFSSSKGIHWKTHILHRNIYLLHFVCEYFAKLREENTIIRSEDYIYKILIND